MRIAQSAALAVPAWIGETAARDNNTDTNNGGVLLASRATLESRFGTSTVKSFGIYVFTVSGTLVLGLYDNDGPSGGPGTLICQTAQFTPVVGWNEVVVQVETDVAPGEYWVCHHPSSSSLVYSGANGVTGSSRFYSRAYNATLPTTFSASPTIFDGRWAVFCKLESKSATYTVSSFPGTPAPISGLGYSVVFQDHFDYYNRRAWSQNAHWEAAALPDQQYAAGSVMTLNSRNSEGHPDVHITTATELVDGAVVQQFQYGYFEAKMKHNYVTGMLPAFWLSASADATNPSWPALPASPPCECSPCWNGEIDIMECVFDGNTNVHGTLHKNTGDKYSVADDINANAIYDSGVNLSADWHVYGILWKSDEMRWYLDGSEIHNMNPPFASSQQSMYLFFSQMPQNSWEGDPSGTSADIVTEIDYVRVWQQ